MSKEDIGASRNIEIKAKFNTIEEFTEAIEIAKNLTKPDNGEIIEQHDVFFNVKNGRLKLRYLKKEKSQLIQYDRPDIDGPKLSKFNKIELNEPELLHGMLANCLGVKGEVRKKRLLFLYKQTRIHLDTVENLGNFLEFEVSLKPDESIETGQIIANELMQTFHINKDNLLSGAYIDELLK